MWIILLLLKLNLNLHEWTLLKNCPWSYLKKWRFSLYIYCSIIVLEFKLNLRYCQRVIFNYETKIFYTMLHLGLPKQHYDFWNLKIYSDKLNILKHSLLNYPYFECDTWCDYKNVSVLNEYIKAHYSTLC